jgi:hypothetical protein
MKGNGLFLLLATTSAAAVFSAACSGSSSSASPTTTPPPTMSPAPTTPPGPTPTPTPSGPAYLDKLFPNGTRQVPLGKCLGFEVVGNGVTFAADATVSVGALGKMPVTFLDETHLQVGAPETGNTCVFTPIFGVRPGPQDVVVTSSSNRWTISAGIDLTPVQVYTVTSKDPKGWFYPTTPRVWTSDEFAGATGVPPGVNTFETAWDVDVYKAHFDDTIRTYPHLDFFDLDAHGLVPQLEFWSPNWPNAPLGMGAFASIFPEPGDVYWVVKDANGRGGPGVKYDLSIIADELGDTATGSTCANAPEIAPGGYHIGDKTLVNNFNPDGTLLDSWFGNPLYGPGPDAVWKVRVPAGQEMRFASYDNHWTNSLYLLPPTTACDSKASDAIEAAGFFGGGSNNVLVWDNDTTSDQMVYVVWDAFSLNTSMTPDDGAFLVNLELFDRK